MHKHSHRQRRKVLMLGKSHDYGDDDEDKRKKQMFALEMGIFPCLGKQTKECCISCFWHTFFARLFLLLSIVHSFARSFISLPRTHSLSHAILEWFMLYLYTFMCACVRSAYTFQSVYYILDAFFLSLLVLLLSVCARMCVFVVIGVKKTREGEGDTWEMCRTTIFNSHFYGFKQTTFTSS